MEQVRQDSLHRTGKTYSLVEVTGRSADPNPPSTKPEKDMGIPLHIFFLFIDVIPSEAEGYGLQLKISPLRYASVEMTVKLISGEKIVGRRCADGAAVRAVRL